MDGIIAITISPGFLLVKPLIPSLRGQVVASQLRSFVLMNAARDVWEAPW